MRFVLWILLSAIVTVCWLYAVRWVLGVGVRLMMGVRGRSS